MSQMFACICHFFVSAAKGSAARRKQRRCRSTMAGSILLQRTGQQHASLPSMDLTNEAMASTDHYSRVPCPNVEVNTSLVSMSVSKVSQCNSEQLQNSSMENFAPTSELLEEVLPVSKHVSTEQVERFDNDGDKQSRTLEHESPGKKHESEEQSNGSTDVLQFSNTQVGRDTQSEDNGS